MTFDENTRRFADFRHESAAEWLEFFVQYFGPLLKAFERLDARDRAAYAAELERLADEFNRADDGSLVIPAEYLEVVMTNR